MHEAASSNPSAYPAPSAPPPPPPPGSIPPPAPAYVPTSAPYPPTSAPYPPQPHAPYPPPPPPAYNQQQHQSPYMSAPTPPPPAAGQPPAPAPTMTGAAGVKKSAGIGGYPEGIDQSLALVVLIVNILAPGVGTMIAGCAADNDGSVICTGVLQLFLAWFLIGWIWAIIWGVVLYGNASKTGN